MERTMERTMDRAMESNAMQMFNYTDKVVRVISRGGEPFFIGKDVAAILGYRDTSDALKKHVDEEDKGVGDLPTPGGLQKVITINESGLYSLILSSKLASAKQFKRWVTSTVLPAIRKHGAYMTSEIVEKALHDPDFLIQLAQELKAEKEKRLALETERTVLLPKAEYCDAVLRSPSLIATNVIAKDYGMSARRFNKMLENLGIQYRCGRVWEVKAQYQDKGYTQSETFRREDGSGTYQWNKWTEKGREFLYNALKERDIIPVSERGKNNSHQI